MNSWILALMALAVGIAVGLIASRLVYGLVGASHRPKAVQGVAKPISQLVLALGIVAGLIAALGFVQPDSLEQLPKDVVAFVPKLMVAAIIIILANVLGSFATAALDQVTGRMPMHIQRQANLVVKGTIVALAVLLAVSQLGIDTEIINMGVAAIFFGLAATLTLLVGLGGHGVAREVASSRALRRLLHEGDKVSVDGVDGTVHALHPTAIEIVNGTGDSVLIPSSRFLNANVAVERRRTAPAASAAASTGATDDDATTDG